MGSPFKKYDMRAAHPEAHAPCRMPHALLEMWHKKTVAKCENILSQSLSTIMSLLGVQFDDVRFVDFVFVRKFFAERHPDERCGPVVEGFFDVRKIESFEFLEALFEHFVRTIRFAEGNDLAGFYRIGRNIDAFAVDVDEAVVDHLARLTDGTGKACAVHQVVQSRFEKEQQVRTGDAGHAVRFIVIAIELTFEDVVNRLDFLLFRKLYAVFGLFLLTGVSGLPF